MVQSVKVILGLIKFAFGSERVHTLSVVFVLRNIDQSYADQFTQSALPYGFSVQLLSIKSNQC